MKEKILELLSNENSVIIDDIITHLKLEETQEFEELSNILFELEKNGDIYKSNKEKYMLYEKSHVLQGVLSMNKKGFGFISVDELRENDVYVDYNNLNGALNKDRVIFEMVKKEEGRPEAVIIKVISREIENVIGQFFYKRGKGCLNIDDEKVKINIEIDPYNTMGAINGHKVIVKILDNIEGNRYKGKVIKIIGHKNDPGVDILSIAYKFNIEESFSNEVMEQVSKMPDEVLESDFEGRKDLRSEMIFTIDGDDTKDIDDAIGIKKLDNGNYLLGVHIADVSHYVKEGTPLDIEAYKRGTSVYLADRVIPMLPHKLSNGICSLNPNVDRLALSCQMEINSKGKVVDYDIFPSIINSKIQMTYNKVNDILENNVIDDEYKPYLDNIYLMNELSIIIRDMKELRGYIEFESSEVKIILDDNGKAIDIKAKAQKTGEKLIEDFMVMANETVATHIFHLTYPFIYRIHDRPFSEKVDTFLKTLSLFGIKIHGLRQDFHPSMMRDILEQLQDSSDKKILSSMMLRVMQKAIYAKENIGHYGLASTCYTHFTSPIRRYPDTIVHRLLRTYVFNNQIDNKTLDKYDSSLDEIATHTSEKERSAVDCEREVNDMKMAEYMMERIGLEYDGVITSVMGFGMFVELENLVEGLVHVSELKGDYYVFDELKMRFVGERTKKMYSLGDKVRIKVIAASKIARTIDFAFVESVDEKDGNK